MDPSGRAGFRSRRGRTFRAFRKGVPGVAAVIDDGFEVGKDAHAREAHTEPPTDALQGLRRREPARPPRGRLATLPLALSAARRNLLARFGKTRKPTVSAMVKTVFAKTDCDPGQSSWLWWTGRDGRVRFGVHVVGCACGSAACAVECPPWSGAPITGDSWPRSLIARAPGSMSGRCGSCVLPMPVPPRRRACARGRLEDLRATLAGVVRDRRRRGAAQTPDAAAGRGVNACRPDRLNRPVDPDPGATRGSGPDRPRHAGDAVEQHAHRQRGRTGFGQWTAMRAVISTTRAGIFRSLSRRCVSGHAAGARA